MDDGLRCLIGRVRPGPERKAGIQFRYEFLPQSAKIRIVEKRRAHAFRASRAGNFYVWGLNFICITRLFICLLLRIVLYLRAFGAIGVDWRGFDLLWIRAWRRRERIVGARRSSRR